MTAKPTATTAMVNAIAKGITTTAAVQPNVMVMVMMSWSHPDNGGGVCTCITNIQFQRVSQHTGIHQKHLHHSVNGGHWL